MISRINNNNYIVSRMSGPRELVYVEGTVNCRRSVIEQPRRPRNYELNAEYTFNTSKKHYIHNEAVFNYSLAIMSALGSAEFIEVASRRITRIQFSPQYTIKWAIYRVDGEIYAAPYNIGYSSVSDILIKQPNAPKIPLVTITFDPTMALDADLSGANAE